VGFIHHDWPEKILFWPPLLSLQPSYIHGLLPMPCATRLLSSTQLIGLTESAVPFLGQWGMDCAFCSPQNKKYAGLQPWALLPIVKEWVFQPN